MNTFKRIVTIIIVVVLIAGLVLLKYFQTRTLYNDELINGNTSGNLYGQGLYCETNGQVYFANPMDDDALYVMNADETGVKKLDDDKVFFINADPHYIYYSRNANSDESQMSFLNVNKYSLCRVGLNGKNIKILDDDTINAVSLVQNTLYYYHYDTKTATTLYKVGIDGNDREMVSKVPIDPRSMSGKYLYYAGVEADHKLHRLDTSNGAEVVVLDANLWNPQIYGTSVFYMDLDDGYRIAYCDLNGGSKTTLSTYGASDFNAYGDYVFYQSMKADIDGLYMLNIKTGQESLIMAGQFNRINVTSQYVYFRDYNSNRTYHCKYLQSPGSVSEFTPIVED